MPFELIAEETARPASQDVTAAALAVCEAVVQEGRYLPHTLAQIVPQAQAALELARQARTPVGQIADALAAQRPPLPLRVCGFCDKEMPWGAATSARYGEEMHAVCATALDAASQRVLSQAERLGYRSGECAWCRRDSETLRSITVPFDAMVCAPCRGIKVNEEEWV